MTRTVLGGNTYICSALSLSLSLTHSIGCLLRGYMSNANARRDGADMYIYRQGVPQLFQSFTKLTR